MAAPTAVTGSGARRLGRTGFVVALVILPASLPTVEAAITGRPVPNLAGGAPADPLPALRANRPAAAEMVQRTRGHPYLFFDAASRPALRDRAKTEPFRRLASRISAHAEACLRRQIPPLARDPGTIAEYLPDGSYNPEFLRNNYDDFYDQAYLIAEVIPSLAFAYQLTDDRRFGEAGRKWLLDFARREKLVRQSRAADFSASYVAYALALGYDWLWDRLTADERSQVRATLLRVGRPIVAAGRNLLRDPSPQRRRGHMGNNHQTRTHGLFGLAPLALLHEEAEAREWLDLEIQLHRDRLYPSAWAPNGEHLDGRDHFDSSLEDPLPFVVALREMGGENFFADPSLAPRFQGIPRYFLFGLEYRLGPEAGGGGVAGRPRGIGWLALARYLGDPTAQWLATHDHGLEKWNPIFSYLLHDPAVVARAPADPTGSIFFPYSGLVKMATGWGPGGIMIPFRCGPEIGKDVGDQNGFRLWAGGEWLAPRLTMPTLASDDPYEFRWDLQAWFGGSPAQNVVLPEPDGIGDYTTRQRREPLLPFAGVRDFKGGIQFAVVPPMKGRDYGRQWLSGPEIPKNGDLRVVHLTPGFDYVCGEAHRAYAYFRPTLWVRHLFFAKGLPDRPAPYVLICDEIEVGDEPRTVAWQLHPQNPFSLAGRELSVRGTNAALTVQFLAPADAPLHERQTPASRPEQRTRFVQWRTPRPQKSCFFLTALAPRLPGLIGPAPAFKVIPAAGGWAVQVTAGALTDVILFRSERAATASAGEISTTGAAAFLHQAAAQMPELYLLGK